MAYNMLGDPSYLGLPTDQYGNPSVVGNQSTFGATPSMTVGGFANPGQQQGAFQTPTSQFQPQQPSQTPNPASIGILAALMQKQQQNNAQPAQSQMPSFAAQPAAQPQVNPFYSQVSAMQQQQQPQQNQFALGNYFLGPPTQQQQQPRTATGQTGNQTDDRLKGITPPTGDLLKRLADAIQIRSVRNQQPIARQRG